MLVDRVNLTPLAVIETKVELGDLDEAVADSTHYAAFAIERGYRTLAIALAGTPEDDFALRVHKWDAERWVPITYDGNPIQWIPNRHDLERVTAPRSPSELRPSVPPPEVLAQRADELNRLLRESGITDQARPGIIGAFMLALSSSRGDLRKDKQFLLSDINQACEQAFRRAEKPDLGRSLYADEANASLAVKARRMIEILERLNVNVLTAEHDYLGQLYESFFQYTGGNTIGQYFTPRHITEFMADLLEVGSRDVVLDPACGTGGFLIAAMERILRTESLSRSQVVELIQANLVGFENEPVTAALCVANMILRGDGSTGVTRDDCFSAPDFPSGAATMVLMNPPFPHERTDVPSERFVERALEGLQQRGRLAVILPTSLLVKSSKGEWRERILRHNTLTAVLQLPDELFQPYASSTTSIVVLERGTPNHESHKTAFVRIAYDGLTLKRRVRVPRTDGRNQLSDALVGMHDKRTVPGFSGLASVSGRNEWGVGAYIPSAIPDKSELAQSADVLIRRLASSYVRYAPEVMAQRNAVSAAEVDLVDYRAHVSPLRLRNARSLPSAEGTIGGAFDVFYGMKELHSREGIPAGQTLVISPTDQYNGTYGWLDFSPAIQPPLVTVAQTGSIGEAFVQLEPCAVNDDCLVLLPKNDDLDVAQLVIAAAVLRLERWRFTYGRKLTPSRIVNIPLPLNRDLDHWITERLEAMRSVIDVALMAYKEQVDTRH